MIEVLEGEGKHRDAEFIYAAAHRRLGKISRQAVYDNLNALTAAGIVRRIEPPGLPSLYELRVDDDHHHLICRQCKATFDVECPASAAACLEPPQDHGFIIEVAEVIYWGLCPTCQTQTI